MNLLDTPFQDGEDCSHFFHRSHGSFWPVDDVNTSPCVCVCARARVRETEFHHLCRCLVYYEIRGRFHCLLQAGFGPLIRGMNYEDQRCLGLFLLELRKHRENVLKKPNNEADSSINAMLLQHRVSKTSGCCNARAILPSLRCYGRAAVTKQTCSFRRTSRLFVPTPPLSALTRMHL